MRIRTPADFGAVARQRRRDLKLSQNELAERSGVTRQWLVRFEKGSREVALSKVFAVLTELDLLVRVDATRSGDEAIPPMLIPTMTMSELRMDSARLSEVREAIQFIDRSSSESTGA
jgi:transcriptional regulator with XRE-family HTH domain